MVKKILISSLCSAMILLSGCGDSEGEERLSIQQMLDDGNYVGVISALESSADSDDDYMALGAAYMGKAGVSLANIVSAMASTDDSSDDGFATFVNSIADISTPSALIDLGKSVENYRVVVGDCTSSNLSDAAKDICLFIGLGATTRTAVTIDNLVGDISKFTDDNLVDDKLKAAACAMQYAFDGRNDSNVDASCTSLVESADVNFTTINKIYTPLTVTVDSVDYHHLLTSANQTVLTSAYCTANSFSRVDDYNATATPPLYACPVNENQDEDDLTTAGVLVDIFNEGMDAISAAATEDIQEDVDEFKCEILDGSYDEFNGCIGADINQDISEVNIIDYLNSKNGL